jgi:hypothetical protein
MQGNLSAITSASKRDRLFITNEELAVMKSHETTRSSGQS